MGLAADPASTFEKSSISWQLIILKEYVKIKIKNINDVIKKIRCYFPEEVPRIIVSKTARVFSLLHLMWPWKLLKFVIGVRFILVFFQSSEGIETGIICSSSDGIPSLGSNSGALVPCIMLLTWLRLPSRSSSSSIVDRDEEKWFQVSFAPFELDYLMHIVASLEARFRQAQSILKNIRTRSRLLRYFCEKSFMTFETTSCLSYQIVLFEIIRNFGELQHRQFRGISPSHLFLIETRRRSIRGSLVVKWIHVTMR